MFKLKMFDRYLIGYGTQEQYSFSYYLLFLTQFYMRGYNDLPDSLPGTDLVSEEQYVPQSRESGVQTTGKTPQGVVNDVKNDVVNMHHMADDQGNAVGSWAV